MPKKVITIIVIILIGIAIGFGIWHVVGGKTDKNPQKEEETLEKFGTVKEPTELSVADDSKSLSEEKLDAITGEVQTAMESFLGVMFNVGPDTPDYSSTLTDMVYTGENADATASEIASNSFSTLQAIHINSTFDSYDMHRIRVLSAEDPLSVTVMGTIRLTFSADEVEQGEYCIPSTFVLQKDGDVWKIYSIDMNKVLKAENYTYSFFNGSNDTMMEFHGTSVTSFDFRGTQKAFDEALKEAEEAGMSFDINDFENVEKME